MRARIKSCGRRAATVQYADACRRSRPNVFVSQEVVFSVRPMCRGDFCFLHRVPLLHEGAVHRRRPVSAHVAKRVGAADYTLAYWRRGRGGYNRELGRARGGCALRAQLKRRHRS